MICSAVSSLTVSRLHISYSRFPCLSVFFPFRYVYSLFLLYLWVRLSGSLFRLIVSLFLSMCSAFPNLPAYTHLSLEQSLSLSLSLSLTHTHTFLSLSLFFCQSLCAHFRSFWSLSSHLPSAQSPLPLFFFTFLLVLVLVLVLVLGD